MSEVYKISMVSM